MHPWRGRYSGHSSFQLKPSSRIIKIGLRSYVASARARRCDGMFDIRFRFLWQWTHPAAGQDHNTDIFVSAVKENHAFRYDCAIKTPLRMRLDRAHEILLPS